MCVGVAWNVCGVHVAHGWSVYSRVRSSALSSSNIMSFFQLPHESSLLYLWSGRPMASFCLDTCRCHWSLVSSSFSSSFEIPLGLQFCEVIPNSTLPHSNPASGTFWMSLSFDLICQRSGMISSPKPDVLPQFLLSLRGPPFKS